MSITDNNMESRTDVNLDTEADSGMESGATTEILSIWDAPRDEILSTFLTGPAFSNNSSYKIPAGVVSNNLTGGLDSEITTGRETGVEVGYTYLGTRVSGTVLVSPDPEADNPQTYRLEGITMHTSDGVNQFTATADPTTGEYELPLGEGGEYEIEARHPALEPVTTTISPADGESVPDTDILIPLESAGSGGSAAGLVRRRIG